MTNMTRDKLLNRGWTEEKIIVFAGKPHGIKSNGEGYWETRFIKYMEKSLSFQSFVNLEEFQERVRIIEESLKKGTEEGIDKIDSLLTEIDNHNCLLKNIDSYDPLKPIYHLVKKDLNPNENSSYTLFTDGCFKSIGSQSFASCAGWIVDNESKEIIIEFAKAVELDPTAERGMPEFELNGISEGVKLISQFGLKNVQYYTDSKGESQTILSAIYNIGDSRYTKNKDFYEPIIKTLKETNSTIAWIPREYNSHADELTKIPLNAWHDNYKKNYIDKDHIKEHGYLVDREKEIYFHQPKLQFKEEGEITTRWQLIAMFRQLENKSKVTDILLYDNENDSFELLEHGERDFSYIDESLPKEVCNTKKNKSDGLTAINITRGLSYISNLSEVTICVSNGITAVCKQFTPINKYLQEEFFEFHKACENFPGKIYYTTLTKNMLQKVNKFFVNMDNNLSKKHTQRVVA